MTCEPQRQWGLFIISVASLSTSNFIQFIRPRDSLPWPDNAGEWDSVDRKSIISEIGANPLSLKAPTVLPIKTTGKPSQRSNRNQISLGAIDY